MLGSEFAVVGGLIRPESLPPNSRFIRRFVPRQRRTQRFETTSAGFAVLGKFLFQESQRLTVALIRVDAVGMN